MSSPTTTSVMDPSVQKLASVIKRVRDILRKVGITDMDSMMHCVLFTAARMLNSETLSKLSLPPPLAWANLINAVEDRDIPAADTQFKQVLRSLDQKFGMNKFPYNLQSQDDFVAIVRAFHEVDIHEVAKHTDVLGYIYEQHLNTGSGSGRDLGKFYTDRVITKYLTKLLGVNLSAAGRPETMCDATMGTGGFILSFIEEAVATAQAAGIPVKWDKFDLAGGDIDDKVAAIARLNVFLKTGIVFEMIRQRNTLKNDIFDPTNPKEHRRFKRLLMNIPFGVKGLKLADDCCPRIKEIIKAGTKSEPLFLALTCQLLDDGGKAAVIVPDGVLVNLSKQHDFIRRYLLDNFEVRQILKMRGKFFMNTGIQPSVIVFERTGRPTTAVEFCDVVVSTSTEVVSNTVLSVPREKFDENCSFDVRKYQELRADPSSSRAAFPMVKLGEILVDHPVKKPVATTAADQAGEFALYSSSCDVFRHSVAEFKGADGPFLLQGSRGTIAKALHYTKSSFAASNNVFVLSAAPNANVLLKYVYYYLRLTAITDTVTTTSVIPMLTKSVFSQIQIPLPPMDVQGQLVNTFDKMLEGDIRVQVENVRHQMWAILKAVNQRGFPLESLDETCSAKNGKTLASKDKVEGGQYPVMGGGTEYNGQYTEFNREGPTITVSKSGTAGYVKFHDCKFWAGDCFTVKPKDESHLLLKYVFHYLDLNAKEMTMANTAGSTIPHCKWDDVSGLKIPVPPIETQAVLVKKLDALGAQMAALEALKKDSEENARFILESYMGGEEC